MKLLHGLAAVFVAAACCGCASTDVQVEKAVEGSLSGYRDVQILVSSRIRDCEEWIGRLEDVLVHRMTGTGKFESVSVISSRSAARDSLLLDVRIMSINDVSTTAKIFTGFLSENAKLNVDLNIIDAANGAILGTYFVEGEAGDHSLSGGTSVAVNEVGDTIRDIVIGANGG